MGEDFGVTRGTDKGVGVRLIRNRLQRNGLRMAKGSAGGSQWVTEDVEGFGLHLAWLLRLMRELQNYAGRGYRRPTAIIPTQLTNFQFTALSQDGSSLLGAAGDAFVLPLGTIPLPAGEPRRLGLIEAQDADLFPDGRILFSIGKDLYIAEKDGSQPRKLLSASSVIRDPSVFQDGERLVFTVYSRPDLD